MSAPLDSLIGVDRFSIVTPLGVRFWDPIAEQVVSDGLQVSAYPEQAPFRRVNAFTNRVGVFVFRDLPGLRALENGSGDAAYWRDLQLSATFVVEVRDERDRFQPFSLTVQPPVRDVMQLDLDPDGSPPRPRPAVPLFSTDSRTVPNGMAVVRSDLWDAAADVPAAWALLEVRLPQGRSAWGLADDEGRVAVVFPYPEPPIAGFESPPGRGRSAFDAQWPIDLYAYYARMDPPPVIPDLRRALTQPPALLWDDVAGDEPLQARSITFGQELVVKSKKSFGRRPSLLLVTTGGSPS